MLGSLENQYRIKCKLLSERKNKLQEPCYRREDRAMPLYISIRIKFCIQFLRCLWHSTHFLLVFVYRLRWIICQKVTSARKNQSDRIVNADK